MKYYVYILQSESTHKTYVGQTNNLERRLKQHNDPQYHGTQHTKRNQGPWKLVHTEEFDSRQESMQREKHLKSGQGREWIKQHVFNK